MKHNKENILLSIKRFQEIKEYIEEELLPRISDIDGEYSFIYSDKIEDIKINQINIEITGNKVYYPDYGYTDVNYDFFVIPTFYLWLDQIELENELKIKINLRLKEEELFEEERRKIIQEKEYAKFLEFRKR